MVTSLYEIFQPQHSGLPICLTTVGFGRFACSTSTASFRRGLVCPLHYVPTLVSVYSVAVLCFACFPVICSFCLLIFRRRLRFLFMFCFCLLRLFGSCCFWFYFVCCFCFLVVGDFAFWVFITLFFVVVVVVATPTVGRVSPGCLVRCRRTGCVVVAPM
jgi:hypothetical protein